MIKKIKSAVANPKLNELAKHNPFFTKKETIAQVAIMVAAGVAVGVIAVLAKDSDAVSEN